MAIFLFNAKKNNMATEDMKFSIKSFVPICNWNIKSEEQNCNLCHNNLMDFPANMYSNRHSYNISKIAKGICGHTFHTNCISGWLNKHQQLSKMRSYLEI